MLNAICDSTCSTCFPPTALLLKLVKDHHILDYLALTVDEQYDQVFAKVHSQI